MQTEQTVSREEERLSAEEVYALRVRLFGEASVPREIATVADLAAASGRSMEEVWIHVDRLRAERAFNEYTNRPRRFQFAMFGVAAVVVASAFAFYSLQPRGYSEEELLAQVAQAKEKRKRQPKKIQYPIVASIKLDETPFPGFELVVNGPLTTTKISREKAAGPVTADEARRRLEKAIGIAYEAAREAEARAPKPPGPIPRNERDWMLKPSEKAFVVGFRADGNGQSYFVSSDPRQGKLDIANVAAEYVRLLEGNHRYALQEPEDPTMIVTPPGFAISIKVAEGTHSFSGMGDLALRPLDPAAVRKRLERVLRASVRQALMQTESSRNDPASHAPPTEAVVSLTGPLRPIEIKLPLREGGEFTTAADAFRTFEERLQAALDEAVRQVREVNEGKR